MAYAQVSFVAFSCVRLELLKSCCTPQATILPLVELCGCALETLEVIFFQLAAPELNRAQPRAQIRVKGLVD